MTTLDRLPLEAEHDHIERVLVSELFRGATDAEVAAFCRVSPTDVRRVRLALVHSLEIRRLLAAAERLAEQHGYEAGALSLLWGALADWRLRNREQLRTRNEVAA